jgi:electron transport complex protein RnfB
VTLQALPHGGLASRILDALPQTQCTRCGYPDCAGYAHAIAAGQAGVNQCPPGGQEGVVRLAKIAGSAQKSLDSAFGAEGPRSVVYIDEDWCIGCTLCIDVCPTDAIIGSNKRMHTVIERYCTGCELCLPVCPVDCIMLENVTGTAKGWSAWSAAQAQVARERYDNRAMRLKRSQSEHAQSMQALAEIKLANLAAHSRITDPEVLRQKKATIESAMARARARRQTGTSDG